MLKELVARHTLAWVFLEAASDKVSKVLAPARLVHFGRALHYYIRKNLVGGQVEVWGLAIGQLQHEDAERPDIRLRVILRPRDYLGRQPANGSGQVLLLWALPRELHGLLKIC